MERLIAVIETTGEPVFSFLAELTSPAPPPASNGVGRILDVWGRGGSVIAAAELTISSREVLSNWAMNEGNACVVEFPRLGLTGADKLVVFGNGWIGPIVMVEVRLNP